MAGKRVRCKQCGQIFQIPAAEADPGAALDALAEMEKSFHAVDASMQTASGSRAAQRSPAETDDDDFAPAPLRRGRTNVRFRYPYAAQVDQYLPWALTLGGLLWIWFQIQHHNTSNVAWIAPVRFAVAVLGYTLVIAPITMILIRKAGRSLGYQMPTGDRWRAYATYLPALALTLTMWLAGGGDFVALLLGTLAGVTIGTAGLWGTFRLRPHEIAPSGLYAGIGFAIGLLVTGGVLLGLNALLVEVMVALKKPDVIPASPFGQGFAWIDPDRVAEPVVAKHPPRPAPTTVAAAPVAPEPVEILPPAPVRPMPTIAQSTSPVVSKIEFAPITDPFDEVMRPLTQSPFVGVVRRDHNAGRINVELWNTNSWRQTATASLPLVPGTDNRYVLSADGDHMARISEFPTLSVQIWNFAESRLTNRPVLLDRNLGTPELIGFAGDTRLLIRWQKDHQCWLEIADIQTLDRTRIDTHYFERARNTLAISPDGTYAAIATKLEDERAVLLVYNLRNAQFVTRAEIDLLDTRWPVIPTGMAFSFDSSKIAVLFEQAGSGLLVCFAIDPTQPAARKIAQQIYAAGPVPGHDLHKFTGNALAWLPTNNGWIIYGQGVFNQSDAEMIAPLNTAGVETFRVISPDTVELVAETPPANQRNITLLRLDLSKVNDLLSPRPN